MKVFVWQWGRFGSGPRFAYEIAGALSRHCGFDTILSLAEGAEIMQAPQCREAVDLPLRTYADSAEFVRRSLMIGTVMKPILNRLRADPPQAAMVPMMGYWDIFLIRALKKMGVPVISMVHDAQVHPGDSFHLAVWLQRRMLRMSDGVITLTDFVARQVETLGLLTGKVHATIPHPAFDFADLNLPPPQPPAGERQPLRLLMAGRLKRYKGLTLLADAMTRVRETEPVHLRVVGSPQHESDIQPFSGLPDVTFDLGWKSDAEIVAHLDWADAVVLPYVEASQSGLAPLAFSRGRAAIATPVGGLPEQVRDRDTGVIASEVSPQALADAIGILAKDGALVRRYGENALRHARDDIGWPAIAPQLAALIEKVQAKGTT